MKLYGNISYIDREKIENDEGQEVYGSNWLANAGVILTPKKDISLNLHYLHVGKRDRQENDPRDSLKGYNDVNLTASINNLGTKNLTIRSGIKNIFNDDIRYPAPYRGGVLNYVEDFPRPGRQYWLSIAYKF